jgi:predicted pyridoxine 5'-phosphate oxidase superfamily flavin-nucleotide-binding protein
MEILEDNLAIPLEEFLQKPLFCSLATVADGRPRVSPLWFRWEDESIWIIGDRGKSYPDRIDADPQTALAVVDFDRTAGRVDHVGMRGRTSIEPHDPDLAIRLLREYLGPDPATWDAGFFGDPYEWGEEMVMLRFDPETVIARTHSYVPAAGVPTQDD